MIYQVQLAAGWVMGHGIGSTREFDDFKDS